MKEKDKTTGDIGYYVRISKGKDLKSSYFDHQFKLIDGEFDNTILLSVIKDLKTIHKDIYKALSDFGGVDKFSSRYC